MSALQVVLRNRNLMAVEHSLKFAKALLATPSTKQIPAIHAHIFCTLLAMVLRKEPFDRLAERQQKIGVAARSAMIYRS
jgi:hypothetical protein